MQLPKWMKRKKYPYTKKELEKLYEGYPQYVIDFVYESFYMGAMVTLSYLGTEEFTDIMDEYSRFMTFLSEIQPDRANEEALREQLIRTELQALLDQAKEPNA